MHNDPHFNISQRFFNISQRCLAHFLLCSMPMSKGTKKISSCSHFGTLFA